ncbi:glycosyltransferase [Rhizobium acaciae]|uniref:glycosyltransferase n=1 Tax=Rhizobium acaciae TaxID=2989736 RepID=UPI003F962249
MKVLIASTPAAGHLNPLLAIARMVKARGDHVTITTGSTLKEAVVTARADFVPLRGNADYDSARVDELWPERVNMPPGPAKSLYDFENSFVDTMLPQAETLRAIIEEYEPDIIIADDFFFGTTVLYLDRSKPCPPIVICGVSVLLADRPDRAPPMLGLHPARDDAERSEYAAIAVQAAAEFLDPLKEGFDKKLASLGLPPLPSSALNSRHLLADSYLQPTARAFEYDFGPLPDHVRFVGPLPPPLTHGLPRPPWWGDLDGGRRIVLVTQGTIANTDFSELLEPTLAALAGCDDVLVVGTTGNRPLSNMRRPIPANARLAEFIDFGELMPRLDLLVTNGGYGTVSQTLKAGVPIVAAGRTEDKAEVGARVGWSGVGIEIPSQRPTVEELREAMDRVLSEPSYRQRAGEIAEQMSAIDTEAEILGILDGLTASVPRNKPPMSNSSDQR